MSGKVMRKDIGYLVCLFSIFLLGITPLRLFAHPSPNTLVFLDVSPGHVAMEVQIPVPELELAWGKTLSDQPETIVDRMGTQLQEYLKAHIHAYIVKDKPWKVDVTSLEMSKTNYSGTNVPYWEVVAQLVLIPQAGESTRKFLLDYDVIMHQVVTHSALLSLRSDWETGTVEDSTMGVGVIRRSIVDDKVYPIEIALEKGSWWTGFKSMFALGMQHIKEGTDHLLFLLVLLLPSMLLVQGNHWGKFGGVKYSAKHLLQIVTAFTIGHSITLLLSAAGWVRLPTQPVEILIAFSILVSAVHAFYPLFPGKEMYVASGFGLIHGLAFAAILSNMKLGSTTLALSILGFNLGIEAMQLFIVIVILPWLILLSTTPAYKWVRMIGAALAAIAALAWIAERSLGAPNIVSNIVQLASQHAGWGIVGLIGLSIVCINPLSLRRRMLFLFH